jgi:hypothetical protein
VEAKRQSEGTVRERKRKSRGGGRRGEDYGGEGEVSSWIASEIFSIAKTQAAEGGGEGAEMGGLQGVDGEMGIGVGMVDYDEIESLMGEYFEEIKVVGSDCGND